MIRSLPEWKAFTFEKGISGDMIFDILKDSEEDRRYILKILEDLINRYHCVQLKDIVTKSIGLKPS